MTLAESTFAKLVRPTPPGDVEIPWDKVVDAIVQFAVLFIDDDEWDAIVIAQGDVVKLIIAKMEQDDPAKFGGDMDWVIDLIGSLFKSVLPEQYHPIVDAIVAWLKQIF